MLRESVWWPCPGLSSPPAPLPPLGEVGRRKREGGRGGKEMEEEEGGHVQGRGVQHLLLSSLQRPPASGRASCFAFTAGLLTGLSVQREGNFYVAFISSRCEGGPRWMDICCTNEFAHRFNCKPGSIVPEQNCLCFLFPLPALPGKAHVRPVRSVSLLVWDKGNREDPRGFEFRFFKGNKCEA